MTIFRRLLVASLFALLTSGPAAARQPFRVADNVSAVPRNDRASEAQSTVVAPGLKKDKCPNGRFLVTSDALHPPQGVVMGRDLGPNGALVPSKFDVSGMGTNFSTDASKTNYFLNGTADHDLVALPNGDVLYVTLAFSRVPLPGGDPEWWKHTFRGNFGPGARGGALTWLSTDCGETFKFVANMEVDPARIGGGVCAMPQFRAVNPIVDASVYCNNLIKGKPYDMGGTDGQLVRVAPGGRVYMTFGCVGYKQDTSESDFTLQGPCDGQTCLNAGECTDRRVLKTLVLASDNLGKWKPLGSLDDLGWRVGVVPLGGEDVAFGMSTSLVFGAKGGRFTPAGQLSFSGRFWTPPGDDGLSDDEGWAAPAPANALFGRNSWSNTVVARAPGSGNVMLAYPSPVNGRLGFRLFFHDRASGTYTEAVDNPILPESKDGFILHLTAIDIGEGPVLLYWYDVNLAKKTATIRGRFVTGDLTFGGADFDISRAGGKRRSFDLLVGDGGPPWYGDYLTAWGYVKTPRLVAQGKPFPVTYFYYPMWVEPTKVTSPPGTLVVRTDAHFTTVEYDSTKGGTPPPRPGEIQIKRSTKPPLRPSAELDRQRLRASRRREVLEYSIRPSPAARLLLKKP